jgi:hypothetical protein
MVIHMRTPRPITIAQSLLDCPWAWRTRGPPDHTPTRSTLASSSFHTVLMAIAGTEPTRACSTFDSFSEDTHDLRQPPTLHNVREGQATS